MIFKGFKFGMLLQLAIGPMCILVFNTAVHDGFRIALSLICAIALVDGLFILLSGFGISTLLKKANIEKQIKLFGAIILLFFGSNTILNGFHISILPNINLFSDITVKNIFFQGLLLTLSNPLTIVFWSGVFSAQITENNYKKKQLFYFGTGCVLSTLVFLSTIAYAGTTLSNFLNNHILSLLNIGVGIIIIYFGFKLFTKSFNEKTFRK